MKINVKTVMMLIWCFAIVLLAWMLVQLPVKSVYTWVISLELFQWFIWILLNTIVILIYVFRWHLINTGLELNTGFLHLLMIRQAGQSFSYVTPGPQFGGEPLQIFWLWKNVPESGSRAFLSVALDRFFELWINFAILIIGMILLILFSKSSATIWYYPLIVTVLMMAGIVFTGNLLIARDHFINKWIKKAVSRWQHSPRLQGLEFHLDNISYDIRRFIINHRNTFNLAIVFSILGWAGMLIELGLILSFLGIELAMIDFVFLVVAMRLALLLPVPGGIGTMEAAIFWVFTSLELNTFDVMGMITLIRLRDLIIVLSGMITFHFLTKQSIENK